MAGVSNDDAIKHETLPPVDEPQPPLMLVSVISDQSFRHHDRVDLGFIDRNPIGPGRQTFSLLPKHTLSHLRNVLAEWSGMPKMQLRLWNLWRRQNKTLRPHHVIEGDDSRGQLGSAPLYREG